MPLGPDYRDLVRLAPGVQVTQDLVRGPSVGGSGQDNVYRFDGVDVSLPMFGTLSAEPSSHDIDQVTFDLPAPRIRERRAKPRRPPWTYRCRHPEREVLIDIDAFTGKQAAALAVVHWGIERGQVDVDGKRRRWMRWIGLSTHKADGFGSDCGWWLGCKMALLFGALPLALAFPVAAAVSDWLDELREQRQLEMAVQRAELERLHTETAAIDLGARRGAVSRRRH